MVKCLLFFIADLRPFAAGSVHILFNLEHLRQTLEKCYTIPQARYLPDIPMITQKYLDVANYLEVPQSTNLYLKVPQNTSKYPKVPQTTQKYLKVPKNTSKYLKIPKSTSKYLKIPKSTQKYVKVPKST